jgi:hypothetical protein
LNVFDDDADGVITYDNLVDNGMNQDLAFQLTGESKIFDFEDKKK